MRCLSLSGLRWAKKTGIFILGKLMTVGLNPRFRVDFQYNINNWGLGKIKEYHVLAVKHRF